MTRVEAGRRLIARRATTRLRTAWQFSAASFRMMHTCGATPDPVNIQMNKQALHRSLVAVVLLATCMTSMPARAKAPAPAPSRATTTSFHFDDIPVRSALQLIAEEGRFNLVVSDSVKGNITLRLKDVTWEQALDIVLRMKGLRQRVDGTATVTVTGG
jgi:type II secretory pathway component HofQ